MHCVVRFPDGSHTVISIPSGRAYRVGDEILPRWLVSRISLDEQMIDGQPVPVQTWVQPVEADDFSAG